jgi:hypothetical protein
MKLLRDILTDYDGVTYDTGRVLAVAIIAALLTFQTVAVINSHTFDVQAFGTGMAAVLAALGVAIGGDNHKRPDK